MTKYIEAARAATIIAEKRGIPIADLVDTFAEIPSADVAEVVRCKDCVSWEKQDDSRQGRCDLFNLYTGKGWYCAGGERKDD